MKGDNENEPTRERGKPLRLRSARKLIFERAHERALAPREYAVAQGLLRRHAFNLN